MGGWNNYVALREAEAEAMLAKIRKGYDEPRHLAFRLHEELAKDPENQDLQQAYEAAKAWYLKWYGVTETEYVEFMKTYAMLLKGGK